MPSPSQDSETLTDAELQRVKEASAYVGLVMHIPASVVHRLCLEVSRHRTPSVPGEDMRERARKFVAQCEGESLVEVLATELSSTADRAREQERERCAKIAEAMSGPGFDCRYADHAQGFCACADKAAAIRAIGKEE